MKQAEDFIIKEGRHKGRLDQRALSSGKPKGSFSKWDKHPFVKGLFYLNWNSKTGSERWYTKEAIEQQEANKKIFCSTPEYKEKKAISDKAYREENREELLEKQRARAKSPRGRMLKRKWAEENREKTREADRKAYAEGRRAKTPVMHIQHIKDYYNSPQGKERKEKHQKAILKKCRKNYLSKPSNRLAHSFRVSLRRALIKDRKGSSLDYLGCTKEEFKEYIESLWEDWMNWDNYGRGGWHIDHIKPCSWFDLTKEKDAKECFHYTNLQPLEESANCSKKDRWEG